MWLIDVCLGVTAVALGVVGCVCSQDDMRERLGDIGEKVGVDTPRTRSGIVVVVVTPVVEPPTAREGRRGRGDIGGGIEPTAGVDGAEMVRMRGANLCKAAASTWRGCLVALASCARVGGFRWLSM